LGRTNRDAVGNLEGNQLTGAAYARASWGAASSAPTEHWRARFREGGRINPWTVQRKARSKPPTEKAGGRYKFKREANRAQLKLAAVANETFHNSGGKESLSSYWIRYSRSTRLGAGRRRRSRRTTHLATYCQQWPLPRTIPGPDSQPDVRVQTFGSRPHALRNPTVSTQARTLSKRTSPTNK
jgi:hypothetical protein